MKRNKQVFNRHVKKTTDIKFLHVVELFSTKEVAKIAHTGELDKDSLFCYLNYKKIRFDVSYVVKGDTIIGHFYHINKKLLYKEYGGKDLVTIRDQNDWRMKIKEINPEIIFSVYNIHPCLWYIKNKMLYVLMKSSDGTFKSYEVNDFMKNHLDNEIVQYLVDRPIEVIGYKSK